MADMDNLGNIQESFEYISEALDSMRAQNAMNAGNTDKVLANINNRLETLANEENIDLIKVFLAELKRSLEERHNFVSSKFSEIEDSFKDITEKAQSQLQAHEIKELFEIIATNLNTFSSDFSAQKDLISQVGLKIEELRQDDSSKKEILKNISTLKVEIEKVSNGFESVILNLTNNFKEVFQTIVKLDSSEVLDGLKKDIENVFLSSNAILSTLQVIDRKNRELEEVITHVVTKEDFNLEREQVAKLIAQNIQLTEYINNLPTQSNFELLTEKIDTSIGVINALKNMINETGKQNQKMLTAQLDNLETKILNISTEEEFIGFRKELQEFAQEIIQSTNLMRTDLADTNADLKDLLAFLSSMDIKNTFANFTNLTKETENSINANITKTSEDISKEIGKNKKLIKVDIDESISLVNEKINLAKQEITEGSKLNLASILEHIQSVINNIFSVKNALHIENMENIEAIDEKFQDLKEELTTSNNFIAQNAQGNTEHVILNIDKVSQEIFEVKENLNESLSQNSKDFAKIFSEISKKINEIKSELNQSSQENFANILSIVEDFSQEISTLKESLEGASKESSQEIREVVENLSEKIIILKDTLIQDAEANSVEFKDSVENLSSKMAILKETLLKNSEINVSSIKDLIENLTQLTTNANSELEQVYMGKFSGLKSDIEKLSQGLVVLQENFDIKSQSNLSKILSLFEELSEGFNSHKEFLSESAKLNFETVSLYIQNLNQKIEEAKVDFNEDLKANLIDVQNSISALPETIKENQSIFENEKKALIEENSKNIADMSDKIQGLIRSLIAKENPFKGEVLNEFSELKSSLHLIKEDLSASNQTVAKEIEEELTSSLQSLETSIVQYSEKYNLTIQNLQNMLNENFGQVERKSYENDLKLDNFNKEIAEIRMQIQSLEENLSSINNDAAFADLSAAVKTKFEGILINITQMEEIFSSKNSDAMKNILTSLEEKFEIISTNLKAYQNFTSEEMDEFIKDVSSKVEAVKMQVGTTGIDIINALSAKNVESSAQLSLISEAVTRISEVNFEDFIFDIKDKVDDVHFSITSAIKETIKNDNDEQLEKISQDFESLSDKLDNILNKSSSRVEEISDLKSILTEIIENIQNASAIINGKLNNNEFLIEQFSGVKDSIASKNEEVSEKINILENKIYDVQSETKEEISNKILNTQDELETVIINEFQKNIEFIKEIITSLSDSKSQDAESVNTKLKAVLERLETINLSSASAKDLISSKNEEVFEKMNVLENKIYDVQSDAKEEISNKILKAQDELETVIINEFQENIEFIKEIITSLSDSKSQDAESVNAKLKTVLERLETINLSSASAKDLISSKNDEIIEKIEIIENNLLQSQKDAKTSILEELRENIDTIKESLAPSEVEEPEEKISEKVDQLHETLQSLSEEIEGKLSKSEKVYKNAAQTLLSEVKTSFYEKVDDSLDELKSFVEVLENKKDFSAEFDDLKYEVTNKFSTFEDNFETNKKDLSEEIGGLKSEISDKFAQFSDDFETNKTDLSEGIDKAKLEIFEKFSEFSENLETSISSINVKEDLENLNNEIELSVTDMMDNLYDKLLLAFEDNKLTNDIYDKTEEISRRIEDLKNSVADDITDKLAEFEISIGKQSQDLAQMMEETKNALAELKESYVDLSLNSTMEISNVLVTIQEKIESIESKASEFNFGEVIEGSKNEIIREIDTINNKIESLNLDFELDPEIKENVEEIRNIVQSQEEYIKQLSEKSEAEDIINSIRAEIRKTGEKFEEKLNALSLESLSEESQPVEIEKELSSFKTELFENLVDFFNQISFVAEAEDIKDFVDEKTQEVKQYLNSLHRDTKEEKAEEYSYTLQDVESDIAKVRMVLSDIMKSSSGTALKPAGDFEQLNENIMSISSRTNKLLLNSDESYAALKSNLDDLRNVVYQFEEKVKYLDNKEHIVRIEKKLEEINNLTLSSVKSDQIFNQTFMYLAEWIDKADEKMTTIEEKLSKVDEIKQTMLKSSDLEMLLDSFSKKFDKQQEKIKSLEDKIEKLTKKEAPKETDIKTIVREVLSKVEMPEFKSDSKLAKKVDGIDRRLTTLGKNIEKITSYVE